MIKLKEELKSLSNNKLSKIKKIAKQFRKELEKTYEWKTDKTCFGGQCHNISLDFVNKLKENGISAYRTFGEYVGVDQSYVPNMEDWEQWERQEYNEMLNYGDIQDIGFAHWWVVADGKWIIDLTADQFHPEEPDEYRIVITDVGDSHYTA